jgi:GNAT superfamily N-acetyltransferase
VRPILRRARPDEADALQALCRRAKQSHGYDDAFMELVFAEDALGITPDAIARDPFMVAEIDGRVAGFAHLLAGDQPDAITLEDLFIEPDAQGQGIGRILFEWARSEAGQRGYAWLEWESDPNAARFYEKVGGEQIGESESTLVSGRMIPKFRIATAPESGA